MEIKEPPILNKEEIQQELQMLNQERDVALDGIAGSNFNI
jgi:hypothetical protein